MRTPSISIALTTTMIIAGACAVSAAAMTRPTSIVCHYTNNKVQGSTSERVGTVACDSSLGQGLGYNISTDVVHGPESLVSGPFKFYFDRGTIHGIYWIITTASKTGRFGVGTYKITGGTGAFRRISGSGEISGSTNDTTSQYNLSGSYTNA